MGDFWLVGDGGCSVAKSVNKAVGFMLRIWRRSAFC